MPLLAPSDPHPVHIENTGGASPFILTVDHSDRQVPEKLGDLGIARTEFDRHIAIDIGILEVSKRLAKHLDAPMVAQRYSRLVIDCNRRLGVPASIPEISDGTPIPANHNISAQDRQAREDEIFKPYHAAIEQTFEAHRLHQPLMIAMHSFTPEMAGFKRPWHVGLLTHHDRRLAIPILTSLKAMEHLTVGDNEPYVVCPDNDYGLMIHGHARGIPHVGFEIRQDLIAHEAGQIEWADRLATVLAAIPVDLVQAQDA